MILRDRVTIETSEDGTTWTEVGTYPAEVRPVATDEQIAAGRDAVVTRYRVFVSQRAPLGSGTAYARVTWRDYGPVEGLSGRYLVMDGGVEQHVLTRRLRFFSFLAKSTLG